MRFHRRHGWISSPRRTTLRQALAGILLALMATGGLAQQTLPGFSEIIDVRVVNVEVVVTDEQGNRVPGLQASDFELLVDGQPVGIDYFSEIREGQLVGKEGVAGQPQTSVPALGGRDTLHTHYLIFVDDLFGIPQDRNRVLDRIEEDLTRLGVQDRVALVAFDGKKLELLTSWTGDRARMHEALQKARSRPAYGSQRVTELRQNDADRHDRADLSLTQIEIIQAAGGEPPDRPFFHVNLDPVERAYANQLAQQVQRSVLAAASALRSVPAPSGRKVMLVLSGGWPFSPAEYTVNDFSADTAIMVGAALDSAIAGRDPLFAPLANTANLLGYTLYPVDLPGLDRDIGTDASNSLADFERYAPDVDAGGKVPVRELHAHRSLSFLAETTGGEALINAQRDHALAEAIEDTRTFYWLGFTPARQEDDVHHQIEVRVKREGLRVRSRKSFDDLSRGTEVTMMVESALLFGDPPSAVPLGLRFGRPGRAGVGKMSVPLEVGIPMAEVTLVQNAGHYVNELEIRTTVMDEQGNKSDTIIDKIPIDGTRPPKENDVFYYQTDLKLRRKPHRLVVAVYDPLSGAILSSSADVSPQ